MKFPEAGVRLLVDNFQECFDFYTEKLGLEVFWGDWNMRCVYFRDPEGNLFEICQDGID